MKCNNAKRYFKRHSIYQKRASTINGTFAEAIVPVEKFDDERMLEAMEFLGQKDHHDHLLCAYCTKEATTWDHLVPKVEGGKPNGPGHQVGNLVPACKDCNSRKRNKDWQEFLHSESQVDGRDRTELIALLTSYRERFLRYEPFLIDETDSKWQAFRAIQNQILELMKEADKISDELHAVHKPMDYTR